MRLYLAWVSLATLPRKPIAHIRCWKRLDFPVPASGRESKVLGMARPSLDPIPTAAGLSVREPQITLLLKRWENGGDRALHELASRWRFARDCLRRELLLWNSLPAL